MTSTIPLPDADLDAKRASLAPITDLVNDRTGLGLSADEMGRMIGGSTRASLASDDLIDLDRDALVALAREEKSSDRSLFTRDASRAHNARVDEARARCDALGIEWREATS